MGLEPPTTENDMPATLAQALRLQYEPKVWSWDGDRALFLATGWRPLRLPPIAAAAPRAASHAGIRLT